MTLYEELGVKPDATDAEIKRAYRRKARETHPDIGGDPVEFAEAVKAYNVLKDPERRLLYDATGQDKRTPIDVEVQNILMEGFSRALSEEKDIEILAFVRQGIKARVDQIPGERKGLKAQQKRLAAKRKKIKTKGPVNIAHMFIDAELKQIDGKLALLDHQEKVTKACLKTLKSYAEEWEAPEMPMLTMADLMSGYSRGPFGR